MSIHTTPPLKDSFDFMEKTSEKYKQEDFVKTLDCVKARHYSLTKEALKESAKIKFSKIDKIINLENYKKNCDKFDERLNKWTFTFGGRSPEGDYLLVTACLDSDIASILNVKRTRDKDQEKYKEDYSAVLDLLAKKKFSYSRHAKQRMHERNLTQPVLQKVLLKGAHEPPQDRFENGRWTFAFRDEIDSKDIRCVVVRKKDHVLVVTVMDLSAEKISDVPADFTSLPSKKSFKKVQDKSEELSFDDLLQLRSSKSASHSVSSEEEESDSPPVSKLSKQGQKRKFGTSLSLDGYGVVKTASKILRFQPF